MWSAPRATTPRTQHPPRQAARRYVLERADAKAPKYRLSGPCRIGSDPGNDVVLEEPTVSALHCELEVGPTGAWIRDDGSSNGTEVDGLAVREAALREGSLIRLGNVILRFH
jgi:pSer/pThr/pTyr-binding forkhead associated (FHA) protein